MAITYYGRKVTPVEYAKLSVESALDAQLYYLDEYSWEYMTEKEEREVIAALERQKDRVLKLINFSNLWKKVKKRPSKSKYD